MSNLVLEDGGKRMAEVTIFLPDVGITPVSALTTFLLTGEMNIRASRQFGKELEDAWDLLRIDRISFKDALLTETHVCSVQTDILSERNCLERVRGTASISKLHEVQYKDNDSSEKNLLCVFQTVKSFVIIIFEI